MRLQVGNSTVQCFRAAHHRLESPACRLLLRAVSVLLLLTLPACTNTPYPYTGQFTTPGQFSTPGVTPATAPGGMPAGTVPTGTVQAPTTGPSSVYAQQQTSPQLVELERRVQQLDDNNRQLTTQIAQTQQQAQAYRERSELLARQLQEASDQNKQLLAATQQYANQARGMQVSMSQMQESMRLRGGARLTANNSLSAASTDLQIPGAKVSNEGSNIRIRLPSDQLFRVGTADLNPASSMMLDQVANALVRQYQRRRVAIEGHTDTSAPSGSGYGSVYQLSSAQAQAVMNYLVQRGGVPTQQLFVVAQGANRPVADNQSPMGQAENRRIEVVIYPETF